jgi:tRNA(fMet)-specific endonuclease VapC
LTILERGGSTALALQLRLDKVPSSSIATTIVTYDEQMRGWLAEVGRAKTLERVVACYTRLERHLDLFRAARLRPFDERAANEFRNLRQSEIRIGTMDLRIAAIALLNDGLLLSRNLKDFQQVAGLRVENWCE